MWPLGKASPAFISRKLGFVRRVGPTCANEDQVGRLSDTSGAHAHDGLVADTLSPARFDPPSALRSPPGNRTAQAVSYPDAIDAPRWVRPAFIALLVATAVLYLYRLDNSGYANSYYSAAAQAGSVSWKAFFFGSLDGGNLITVDKPPAALWFMTLSIRIFGLSSWAVLLPQALMGVATVALLYVTVRRWNGPVAGLLAAAALAATPVATLMFRFNNPDALLTLLVVAAAYGTTRAIETVDPRWMYFIGGLVGLGFLTKLLQAFLVVPAFALTYLIAAPIELKHRVLHLLRAALALVVVAGSWLAAVGLTPRADRPWVGSTTSDSIWDLTIGYNGLGRLTGNEVAGGAHFAGSSGSVLRMFGGRMIVDVSWLLIAAVISLLVGLVLSWKAPRTDLARASLIMWGTWLITCVAIFSGMSGIFHSYYSIEVAPAIAALFGTGATTLWRHRHRPGIVVALVASVGFTTVVAVAAFAINPGFLPWLMWALLAFGIACTVGWAGTLFAHRAPRFARSASRPLAVATIVACLAAPVAFSISTAAVGHVGSSLSSGPQGTGRDLANRFDCGSLVTMLRSDSADYRWVAAASRVRIPAAYQLATGLPVMPIGGFYGEDGAPTLRQFTDFVNQRQIHYYIEYPGKRPKGPRAAAPSAQIQAWVRGHYQARRMGEILIYDLSQPASASEKLPFFAAGRPA